MVQEREERGRIWVTVAEFLRTDKAEKVSFCCECGVRRKEKNQVDVLGPDNILLKWGKLQKEDDG